MSITRIRDKNVTIDAKALAAERRNPRRPLMTRRAILRAAAASITLPVLESLVETLNGREE
jgi:hypothetical protein